MNMTTSPFYIAAHESGSLASNIPLWGSRKENPFKFSDEAQQVITRTEIEGVPGAFQLLNVLSEEECQALINATENMEYTEDAAVSLGRHIRHNMNLSCIVDTTTERLIWSRIAPLISDQTTAPFTGKKPLGLNQRFRFYRYEKGDYFGIHTDGAWPGSKIVNEKPVADAFGDRYSLYTFLIFLSDEFTGGETQFLVDKSDPTRPARTPNNAQVKGIRTPAGGVLCFPHGTHPLHCLHGSQIITQGVKYIIRTDLLFSL
jgi:hypothetical protein